MIITTTRLEFFNVFCFCSSQAVLRQHAADEAKLSYTGEPIVKWPKRVRSRHSWGKTAGRAWYSRL